MKKMTAVDIGQSQNQLQEIIQLQLKKPRNWNWQLSTSNSSPHISFPVIKLYDYKGRLLLDTTDDKSTNKQSWHSTNSEKKDCSNPTNVTAKFTEASTPHLQRCRSDILDSIVQKAPNKQNKQSPTTINKKKKQSALAKCPSEILQSSINQDVRNKCRTSHQRQSQHEFEENEIKDERPRKKELPYLRKSRSDVLQFKGSNQTPNALSQRFNKWKRNSDNNEYSPHLYNYYNSNRHHRRTKSDDAFNRKLIYNEASLQRAKTDGYKNFLNEGGLDVELPLREDGTKQKNKDDDAQNQLATRPQKHKVMMASQAGKILLPHSASNTEVSHFTHPRYKTRTSSAGTLIISEETFANSHHRRRRRSKYYDGDDISIPWEDGDTSFLENNIWKCKDNYFANKIVAQHVRQRSDPTQTCKAALMGNLFAPHLDVEDNTSEWYNISEANVEDTLEQETWNKNIENRKTFHMRQKSDPVQSHTRQVKGKPTDCMIQNRGERLNDDQDLKENQTYLHHSKSEKHLGNFIIRNNDNLPNGNDSLKALKEGKFNGLADKTTKGDLAINGKLQQRKKRRKLQRRSSDGSTSSGTQDEKYRHKNNRKRNEKACKIKDSQVSGGVVSGDGGDLLQLVRHISLSHDHHVIMGANVSRHSSKGLSGRRSQSSGSICNGKGRPEDKICASLPSYLDDQNDGCNNNHDCEKADNEVSSRIPPLGEGAPLHWKFSDTQTVLCDQGYGSERSPEEENPPPLPEHDVEYRHLEPHACYPFVTPESTFTVKLAKGSRGLGLSVTGGIDNGGSWPGLIRIKRLFPHQPASLCGLIHVGDLLLEANGIPLTGLSNYEALEVLRTAANQVELKVCRPPPDVLSCVSPISEVPPPPPRREPPASLNFPSTVFTSPEADYYHGDFEVTLTKIQGSLGFTLRKEDDSALGHYVRALVREPALTDGRIKAGDKIIAVNDVEISPMSHEQAVQFLRQSGNIVKLRLYRDSAQTPVAALSPTETTPRASFSRKANLRQEAVDMLNDIAVRKLIPGNDSETCRRSQSPNSSPRKLRRPTCNSDASQETDSNSSKYLVSSTEEQFHEGILQYPYNDDTYNSLFIVDDDDPDKPPRPGSLDLYNPNQTPVATRKPRFNFSLAHNAYELNNLDSEVLDAPNLTYNMGKEDVKGASVESDGYSQEHTSMPHIPLDNPDFSHKNPAYQSAHPQCGMESDDCRAKAKSDNTNMKKWKGVVFEGQDEPQKNVTTAAKPKMQTENEILAIELNRGWNSRLGFSLQGAAGVTYVSAVHANSVAFRDGRLKPGDRLIKVNDESIEHLTTSEIIDLLRIVRGAVCIVVSRSNAKEDCLQSNAVN